MSARDLQTDLLLEAAALLLEYNESTGEIQRALQATANTISNEPCHLVISYDGVAIALGDQSPKLRPVRELRYNTTIQARVHEILRQVRQQQLEPSTALASLMSIPADAARHPPWLVALLLGAAAFSLAAILAADITAAAVAGVGTGLGFLVRHELGRRHFTLLLLPFMAAFIGGVLGGLAIRMSWTQTPELVLVVPALMLIPGPHLINGLLDLIDNYLPMSLARFGLAIGILLANASGLALGAELTLLEPLATDHAASSDGLTLISDIALAGMVACGFALFYNTAWRHLWPAMSGGMAGHGLRFLALKSGWPLEAATFVGGLTVGLVSGWIAWSREVPIAVIGFAGAVAMIPGVQIYRALAGAWQMARQGQTADPATVATMLGNGFQAILVVSGLALGFLIGARLVLTVAGASATSAPTT